MKMTNYEVKTLCLTADSENTLSSKNISRMLGIRQDSVSRIITRLEKKGLVERSDNGVILTNTLQAECFKKLYYKHRTSPFEKILSDQRMNFLSQIDSKPKSVEDITKEISISNRTIYNYLKNFLGLGIVKKTKIGKKSKYSFNYILWNDLKKLVDMFTQIMPTIDIPRDALLIKDYGDHVLFKSKKQLDAKLTAFSAYEKHGIKLFLRDNYYTLPKRDIPIEDIFIHSMDSAEDITHRMYCILFYLKNRDRLKTVKHPMVRNIKSVLNGRQIKGYPSYEELLDRATLYDIVI